MVVLEFGESEMRLVKETRCKFVTYCTAMMRMSTVSVKADSHIACRSHAAPMPFPCHAVPLRV